MGPRVRQKGQLRRERDEASLREGPKKLNELHRSELSKGCVFISLDLLQVLIASWKFVQNIDPHIKRTQVSLPKTVTR